MRACLVALFVCNAIAAPVFAQEKAPGAEELREQVLAKLILQNQRLQDWEDAVLKTQERLKKSEALDGQVSYAICQKLLDFVREENLFNQLDVLQDRFTDKVIDLSRPKDVDSAASANAALSKHYGELKKQLLQGPRYARRIEAERWEDIMIDLERIYRLQAKIEFQKDDADVKMRTQAKVRALISDLRTQARGIGGPDKKIKKPLGPPHFDDHLQRIIEGQLNVEELLGKEKLDDKELRYIFMNVLRRFQAAYQSLDEYVVALQGLEKLAAMDDWQQLLERAAERLRGLEEKSQALAKAGKPNSPLTAKERKQAEALAGLCRQIERDISKVPSARAARDVSGPLIDNVNQTIRTLRQLENRMFLGDFGPETLKLVAKAIQSTAAAAKLAVSIRELLAIVHQPPAGQPLPEDLASLGKQLDAIVTEQQAIQQQLDAQRKRLKDGGK